MNEQTFTERSNIETIGKWKIYMYTTTEKGKELFGLKIYNGAGCKLNENEILSCSWYA